MDTSSVAIGRTRVKVCGVTTREAATVACLAGADAIGLNFYKPSPRCISIEVARDVVRAIPALVETVAVFVNAAVEEMQRVVDETGISAIQLHGDEPPEVIAQLAPRRVVRAFRWKGPETCQQVEAYIGECDRLGHRPAGLLIDAHQPGVPGGTGERWDWSQARLLELQVPLILAGGLNPGNVAEAIRTLRPYAVDVASGVESSPGMKCPQKIRAFLQSVREADTH